MFSQKIINFIKNYGFIILAAASMLLPDIMLRGLIRDVGFSDTYVKIVSWLFTISWIFLILFVCIYVLPKRPGRIFYIIISVFFTVLSFCQYIYFKIFDLFFGIKSITMAGQGADYLGYAIEHIDITVMVMTALSALFCIFAAILWRPFYVTRKKQCFSALAAVLVLAILHFSMHPVFHGGDDEWDSWRKPSSVYTHFSDVNKSYSVAGLYQFTLRDIFKTVFPASPFSEADYKRADEYFELKDTYGENEYTAMFEGKNVIAVMMESIDTWMIDEKYTPTICKMLENSINFTNYNAPFFGVGFTFNSEFAFNTGYYTPSNAVSAAHFSSNAYPYATARLFKNKGYAVNSFHFNEADFYNRGIMHKSFGYENYHSFPDFGIPNVEAQLDSNAVKNDDVYRAMTENQPFYNFIVTYSAHLPYNTEDDKLKLAKEYRPDLIDTDMNAEKNNALILAADTDEFFRVLLERLEADGILDDTVIVAFTDHFAYGISEDVYFSDCKPEGLKYTIPAFIYCKGMEAAEVSKPMMTTDWPATMANLFGLERSSKYLGADVLAPENSGFAYLETFAWMEGDIFYDPSQPIPEGIDEEYIKIRNARVRESREINDIVITGDYFAR